MRSNGAIDSFDRMKLHRSIAWSLPLLVMSFACGGGSNPAGGTESDQPAATNPSASETSQGSTGASSTSAPEAGGDVGGTGGIDTALTDGNWTGGSVHVEMSGDATGSLDADLLSANSITDGQSTTLFYTGAEGVGVGVAIYPDSWAISVTTSDLTGGGGTTTECTVTYESVEDDNVAGAFSCPNSPVFTLAAGSAGTVTFEGSFDATR